eukprot:gene2078-biopygen16919
MRRRRRRRHEGEANAVAVQNSPPGDYNWCVPELPESGRDLLINAIGVANTPDQATSCHAQPLPSPIKPDHTRLPTGSAALVDEHRAKCVLFWKAYGSHVEIWVLTREFTRFSCTDTAPCSFETPEKAMQCPSIALPNECFTMPFKAFCISE